MVLGLDDPTPDRGRCAPQFFRLPACGSLHLGLLLDDRVQLGDEELGVSLGALGILDPLVAQGDALGRGDGLGASDHALHCLACVPLADLPSVQEDEDHRARVETGVVLPLWLVPVVKTEFGPVLQCVPFDDRQILCPLLGVLDMTS